MKEIRDKGYDSINELENKVSENNEKLSNNMNEHRTAVEDIKSLKAGSEKLQGGISIEENITLENLIKKACNTNKSAEKNFYDDITENLEISENYKSQIKEAETNLEEDEKIAAETYYYLKQSEMKKEVNELKNKIKEQKNNYLKMDSELDRKIKWAKETSEKQKKEVNSLDFDESYMNKRLES
jgi:hypothetical protein